MLLQRFATDKKKFTYEDNFQDGYALNTTHMTSQGMCSLTLLKIEKRNKTRNNVISRYSYNYHTSIIALNTCMRGFQIMILTFSTKHLLFMLTRNDAICSNSRLIQQHVYLLAEDVIDKIKIFNLQCSRTCLIFEHLLS